MYRTLSSLAPHSACLLAVAGLMGCTKGSGSSGVDCSSVNPDLVATASEDACYPDNDSQSDTQTYTIDIAVTDTGFTTTGGGDGGTAKNLISTQNESPVVLTLTNNGTKPHGFQVSCVSVCTSYPTLPAGCSPKSCFPSGAAIAPMAPGTSTTVTFDTPTADGLIYPYSSSAPDDASVAGLNQGQWSLL